MPDPIESRSKPPREDRASTDRRRRLGSRIRATVTSLLVALALALISPTADAVTLVSARVGSTTDSGTTGLVSAAEPTAFGNHGCSASLGRLEASSALDFGGSGSDDGRVAIARFSDDITVTAPGATTGSGIMTVRVRIDGGPAYSESRSSVAVSQVMNTGYQVLTVRAGGTGNFLDGSIFYNTGTIPELTITGTSPAPGLVDVEFIVPFGFPIELGFEVNARAGGSNSFLPPEDGTLSGSSTVSLVWEGITSIRDLNDNELLEEATVTGASGTDWTSSQAAPAVPIGFGVAPGVALLLIWAGMRAVRGRRGPQLAYPLA